MAEAVTPSTRISTSHPLSEVEKTELINVLLSNEFSAEKHIFEKQLSSSRPLNRKICAICIDDLIPQLRNMFNLLKNHLSSEEIIAINIKLGQISSYDGYTGFIELFKGDIKSLDIEKNKAQISELEEKIELLEASKQKFCVFSVTRLQLFKEVTKALAKALKPRDDLEKYSKLTELLNMSA